jgi:hypothetical protein
MKMETYERAYYFGKEVKTVFAFLRFVALAAGKDGTRPMMMRRILVEDGCAIATDGRRLHFAKLPTSNTKVDGKMIETDLIEPGDYRIIVNSASAVAIGKLKDADQFPAYKKILPVAPVVKTIDYLGWPKTHRKFAFEFTKYCHDAGRYCAVSMDYLADLSGYHWDVKIRSMEDTMAIEFNSGDMSAIIMPMNID